MNKNLIWKLLFIIALALLALWVVYPPQEKLKLGLDLAGGTSLVYEIDTTGLSADERKGLAESMIPILLKRIDPTHMANIVMRPQEDTRIEIQLPVSSPETQKKRKAYEEALTALENENINLLQIKNILSLDPQARQAGLEPFAQDNPERMQILRTLAETYDLRADKQQQRDRLTEQMEALLKPFEEEVDPAIIRSSASMWADQPADQQRRTLTDFVKRTLPQDPSQTQDRLTEKQENLLSALQNYLQLYGRWAPVVNALTDPENGANIQWNRAVADLNQLNLSIDQLQDILDLPGDSIKRREALDQLKEQFKNRADKISHVEKVFEEYRKVAGSLDDPEDLKRMLKGAGVLEFRILPISGDGITNMDEMSAYVEALKTKGPKQASDSRYVWIEIEDPGAWPPTLGITGQFGDKTFVLASNQPKETMLHTVDKKWKLKRANPTRDNETGRRAIGFSFNQVASNMFFNLTKNNLKRPLCIILDDLALSAPTIDEAISSQGIIRGSFSPTEQTDLVNKLNAGSFRAKLSDVPISEKTIGPLLGADNLNRGMRAGIIGLIAVAVFMFFYYLLVGAIADLALMLNIIFVLAMMAGFNATFTLPGIAGLILTIGMSVDANVLIFERIREEQKRGSSLRAAIANGYGRAFRTIFDANLTTFGVAFILLMVASEEIKGFAIVLMLGIVASMFTAIFVTRVILDFLVSRRIISNHLTMLGMLQNANFNWMALRPLFLLISAALIIGGLGVFFTRDETANSKYDIEFTGGTSAQINLREGTAYTREIVESKFRQYADSIGNRALAAAKVYSIGESNLQYEITTTETNRTTATVTFPSPGQTPVSVAGAIQSVAQKLGQTFSGLEVTQKDTLRFQVSTSRVNKSLVEEVLQEAFPDTAEISEVAVNEVVSDAIRNAFKDLLNIREDLQPKIESMQEITVGTPELADYLGGIRIQVKLASAVSGKELKNRIQDIKFKRDMEDLQWYTYRLLNPNLAELSDDDVLDEFVYVSVHPEAGFRDLSENEWNQYVENEKIKVTNALSIESSLARVTQIDPSIGAQAKIRALLAILLSLIAIVLYIGFRFGTARYGFAAIIALVHDVCITLGIVTACTYIAGTPVGAALGIGDFKINLEMIAAFLTIIGYSLNDTIVVFDRIRENRGKLNTLTPKLINDSINQTLSRTLLTSFTTFLVVLIMYIWGGVGLRGFTFAMLIGIIVGTYSSIAIAAPILLIGQSKEQK